MSTTYQIAEAAERSGFSPSALRYYESIGLLTPERTDNGYRTYDDANLDRLAFIARAKQLGCTLDETTELVEAWEGGWCAPVQQRLRGLAASKLADARERIAELGAIVAQLQHAARSLEGQAPEGPCDETCGCGAPADTTATTPIDLGRRSTRAGTPPIACTLDASELPGRVEAWQQALADVERREAISGGLRLVLRADSDLGELARLAAAEQGCCAFFSFALTLDARGAALEVRAPDDAGALLTDVFGAVA